MKNLLRALRVIDWVILLPLLPAALLLRFVRRAGLHRLPAARSLLLKVGVLPVRNH